MEKESIKKSKWDGLKPLVYDAIVPTVIYFVLHFSGVNDLTALTVAGVISAGNAVTNIIKNRKASSLSIFVFLMFVLSIIMTIVIKDPRIILLKPAIFIEFGAAYCLISTFKRPLILDAVEPFATDGDPVKIKQWQQAWLHKPLFKKRIRFANVSVSVVIALEGFARAILALNFSLKSAIILSNLPIIALIVFFALLGRFYMKPTSTIAFEK